MSIWSRLFRRAQPNQTEQIRSEESGGERSDPETAHVGPLRLRTVGDFLKLSGMRIEFHTKQGEYFEATVRDLSDAGTHILLDDVLRIELTNVPFQQIVRVARKDLVDTGDLSQYVGQCIRLATKPVGFVQGILDGSPQATEYLELSMVQYYHPCEKRTVLISEVDFVEVKDRMATLW